MVTYEFYSSAAGDHCIAELSVDREVPSIFVDLRRGSLYDHRFFGSFFADAVRDLFSFYGILEKCPLKEE